MKKLKKIIIASIIDFIIIIAIGITLFTTTGANIPQQFTLNRHITVTESVATPAGFSVPFTLKNTGDYAFYMEWKTSEPGMITGVSVIDEQGNYIFSCSAESCMIESKPFELKAGTYTVQFTPITSEIALAGFTKETQITRIQGKEEPIIDDPVSYPFVNNLEEELSYHFEVRNNGSYLAGRRFGIASGILLGILIVYIILAVVSKSDSVKSQYDERQEMVRGRGYKYGFAALVGLNFLGILLHVLEIPIPADIEIQFFFTICMGVFVYASYCIWYDGYFPLNESRKGVAIFMAFASAINLAIGIMNLIRNEVFVDQMFTVAALNLLAGIMCAILFVQILLKQVKDKKEAQNEES